MKKKCSHCGNPATHIRKPDLDCIGIPLCDMDICFYIMIIEINGLINE